MVCNTAYSASNNHLPKGDNIGYGPDSEPIMKKIAEYDVQPIADNYEMAVQEDFLNGVIRLPKVSSFYSLCN